MFRKRGRTRDEAESPDIFAPVADLMVGVVFIFMVLMIALTLQISESFTLSPQALAEQASATQQAREELVSVQARLDTAEKEISQSMERLEDEREAKSLVARAEATTALSAAALGQVRVRLAEANTSLASARAAREVAFTDLAASRRREAISAAVILEAGERASAVRERTELLVVDAARLSNALSAAREDVNQTAVLLADTRAALGRAIAANVQWGERDAGIAIALDHAQADAVAATKRAATAEAAATAAQSLLAEFRDKQLDPALRAMEAGDRSGTHAVGFLADRLRASGSDVTFDLAAGTLSLPAGNLFESGKAEPTQAGAAAISRLGEALASLLPCRGGSPPLSCGAVPVGDRILSVYIEGHTDAAALASGGRYRDNLDLSAARALEAYKLMRNAYPVLATLKNTRGESMIGVSGYGDTRPTPADPADRMTPAVRDLDRRIGVRIIMAPLPST